MADPVKLAEHVQDSNRFEFPFQYHLDLPKVFRPANNQVHGLGVGGGSAYDCGFRSFGAPNRLGQSTQGPILEHVRGDAVVHSRSSSASGYRASRCRSLSSVYLDVVFLYPVLQSAGIGALGRFADFRSGSNGLPGDYRAFNDHRGGHISFWNNQILARPVPFHGFTKVHGGFFGAYDSGHRNSEFIYQAHDLGHTSYWPTCLPVILYWQSYYFLSSTRRPR